MCWRGFLSPSVFLSCFLCFDCDSVCGEGNEVMWNDDVDTALGVKQNLVVNLGLERR